MPNPSTTHLQRSVCELVCTLPIFSVLKHPCSTLLPPCTSLTQLPCTSPIVGAAKQHLVTGDWCKSVSWPPDSLQHFCDNIKLSIFIYIHFLLNNEDTEYSNKITNVERVEISKTRHCLLQEGDGLQSMVTKVLLFHILEFK